MAMTKEGIISLLALCSTINAINILIYFFNGYRKIHRSGAAYDLAFGVETTFNLFSDCRMLSALDSDMPHDDPVQLYVLLNTPPSAKVLRTLSLFLIWNTATTVFCYAGHIAASKFKSKYERIGKLDEGVDEESYRKASFINGVFQYTLIALFKVYVLYGIYGFYAESKKGGILPRVVERVVIYNVPSGAAAGVPESPAILIRESMDARMNTCTGTRAVTRVQEFVRVSGERGSSPMNRPAQKDAGATTHSLEGTPISVDAKLQKQSSSENSICGGQPQQALEVPEAVFPAIRRENCARAGRGRPWRGTM